MKYSLLLIAMIAFMALTAISVKWDLPSAATEPAVKQGDFVAHEWGTFTSIAGKNGVALDWRPLNGPTDLPKFVYSQTSGSGFRGTYDVHGKGDIARVRMETPVIYFYAKEAMDIDVHVFFPKGTITEWYPQASAVNNGYKPGSSFQDFSGKNNGITWGTIKLLPNATPNFLREPADSHYYPARETDATTIQVCNADKTLIENEKFLFYRGIGNFELPLKVRVDGDHLVLGTTEAKYGTKGHPGHDLSNLIVFENRDGHVGFEVVPSVTGDTPVKRPQLNKTLGQVYAELESTLVSQGLYQKEARAMIETWKDSWFEPGLRVFYLMPRATTDEVLPLEITPHPKETVRVLVGRTEVITPEMQLEVRRQVKLLRSTSAATREQALKALKQNGRFFEPILKTVLKTEKNAMVRKQIEGLLKIEQS